MGLTGIEQFTGSYRPDQTIFLLVPVTMPSTPVEEKERLIQTGRRHYSEMLTFESAPLPDYVELFRDLTTRYKRRLASELNALADVLTESWPEELTLVSLARAGTPIGALLRKAVELRGRTARHYSVSIVLGRGIDEAALRHLLEAEGRDPGSIRFIDGWTAKGTIGRELRTAIERWNAENGSTLGSISSSLHVVMDLSGTAEVSATLDDYAIPCGILNATVSGLVSRTVLPPGHDPAAFHACVYYSKLAVADLTQWFYTEIAAELGTAPPADLPMPSQVAKHRIAAADFLERIQALYGIDNIHRVKPGVAEATRAVLRRHPERVVVRDPEQTDVAHLLMLSRARNVPIEAYPHMPFNAFTLIRRSDA